jgi:hypothetical protein
VTGYGCLTVIIPVCWSGNAVLHDQHEPRINLNYGVIGLMSLGLNAYLEMNHALCALGRKINVRKLYKVPGIRRSQIINLVIYGYD